MVICCVQDKFYWEPRLDEKLHMVRFLAHA